MAERYTRLYTLPASLYSPGAPVEILAGAMLKDNSNGSLKCQLKYRVMSAKAIRSLSVTVTGVDEGMSNVDSAEYTYSDLSVGRGVEFGSRNAITLSSSEAAFFTVAVNEVVFDDGSVWSGAQAEWEAIPAQRKTKEALPEYYQQVAYGKLFGKNAIYEPTVHSDIWLCTCSSHNRNDEEACPVCGCAKSDLFSYTPHQLNDMGIFLYAKKIAKEAAGRVSEYERAREVLSLIEDTYEPGRELAEKIDQKISDVKGKAKRRKRRTLITLSTVVTCLLLLIGFLVFNFAYLVPNSRYEEAMLLYSEGKVSEAYDVFESCKDYKDSADMMDKIVEAEYVRAQALVAKGEYEAAYVLMIPYDIDEDKEDMVTAWQYLAYEQYKDAVLAGITHITIKEGVDNISSGAFEGCTGLVSITLPKSMKKINKNAFKGCTGLTSINLPESVMTIEESAFEGCTGLRSIVIPNSVTIIKKASFKSCTSLSSVTLPASLEWIDEAAFMGCTSLVGVSTPATLRSIADSAFEGCSSLTSLSLTSGVTLIGSNAFASCTSLESVSLPSSVTSTGTGVFKDCTSLKWASLSTSMGEIMPMTFLNCKNLATVSISSTTVKIGSQAFKGCSSLVSFSIPSTVTSIGDECFSGASKLTSITVPANVKTVGRAAFAGCASLTQLTLPFVGASASLSGDSSVAVFGYVFGAESFEGGVAVDQYYSSASVVTSYIPASLKSVTVTSGVIHYGAFYNCKMLTNVVIGEGVTAIGSKAFYGATGLTEIKYNAIQVQDASSYTGAFLKAGSSGNGIRILVGSKVRKIPKYLFAATVSESSSAPKISEVNLSSASALTKIGDYAFANCKSSTFTMIAISPSVAIGNNAFYNCSQLTVRCQSDRMPSIWYSDITSHVKAVEYTAPRGTSYDNAYLLTGSATVSISSQGQKVYYEFIPTLRVIIPLFPPVVTIRRPPCTIHQGYLWNMMTTMVMLVTSKSDDILHQASPTILWYRSFLLPQQEALIFP